MKKFQKELSRLAPRHFFLEILSPSEPIFRAIIENMNSPDYVLCYIPRALGILDKKWKFGNWLVRRWRPLCGFGNFGRKILNFWIFFRNLEKFENYVKLWKLWVISKKQILTLGVVYSTIIQKCKRPTFRIYFEIPNVRILKFNSPPLISIISYWCCADVGWLQRKEIFDLFLWFDHQSHLKFLSSKHRNNWPFFLITNLIWNVDIWNSLLQRKGIFDLFIF